MSQINRWSTSAFGQSAYKRDLLDTDSNASSDSERIHGGPVLKYNPGPLLLAGAVSG